MDGVIDSYAIMKTNIPLSKTVISVVMYDESIANLDLISIGIRQATGTVLNRSALIRAILAVNLECSSEWTPCQPEAELVAIIRSRLIINSLADREPIKQPAPHHERASMR